MPTPDPHAPHDSNSPGYEVSDVNTGGILVFMVSLFVFVAVFFVFCFGMGKVINTAIANHDGPLNRWNQTTEKAPNGLQNLASNAVMEQQELQRMTQQFPTPRLQMDDGDQDLADLHAREDLLLDHYSWVDRQQGKVRIPIARAMELIAQHGLPVAPGTPVESLMTADTEPVVPAPLTDGFARTGYEQQYLTTMQQQRARGEATGETAAVGAQH
jgi:hypothetical protein